MYHIKLIDIEASSSHGDFHFKKNIKTRNKYNYIIQENNIIPTNDFLQELCLVHLKILHFNVKKE